MTHENNFFGQTMLEGKEVSYLLPRCIVIFASMVLVNPILLNTTSANEVQSSEQTYEQRMQLYKEADYPWHQLAAVDQYERNIQAVRTDIPKREGLTAIQFSMDYWAGESNPYQEDTAPASIGFFGGFGIDGNADGVASPTEDEDVIASLANYLNSFGIADDDYEFALFSYYKSEEAVKQIKTIAQLYEKFDTLDLDKHFFPLPVQFDYSYRSTWGANRGWGGKRTHEGTDLFAGYGTQIYATSYGIVETMGWNDFGGWRIGIRDHRNTYHYYAHLNSYDEKIKVGEIVEPGTLLGFVGSSGYGKEGTAGKFSPHLHYGMYKFNGRTEWAFDPFPSLQLWERQTKGGD